MAVLSAYTDENFDYHHSVDPHPSAGEFSLHAHDCYEIYWFISGKAVFSVEGNQYRLSDDDLMIFRPGEVHRLLIDENKPYERIALHFSPLMLERMDPDCCLLTPFNDRVQGRLNRYARSEWQFGQPCASPSGDWKAFLLNAIQPDDRLPPSLTFLSGLLPFLRILSFTFFHRQASEPPTPPLSVQLVDYVNRHLFEPLSLRQISDQFFISCSQVSRLFRTATGSSFLQYVRMKRLTAARLRIQKGENPQTAAGICGFPDYSTFWRAYKERYGITPSKERAELSVSHSNSVPSETAPK